MIPVQRCRWSFYLSGPGQFLARHGMSKHLWFELAAQPAQLAVATLAPLPVVIVLSFVLAATGWSAMGVVIWDRIPLMLLVYCGTAFGMSWLTWRGLLVMQMA